MSTEADAPLVIVVPPRLTRRRRHGSHGHATPGNASAEYRAWRGMRQKCYDPKHSAYRRYGGRDIRVAARWERFDLFLADMGPKPSPDHWLVRIDSDGDFSPGNVIWLIPTRVQRRAWARG